MIIETFSEKTLSYKGYISWLLLANSNVCYLIDCAILHNDILYLQHVSLSSYIGSGESKSHQACVKGHRGFKKFEKGLRNILTQLVSLGFVVISPSLT